MGNPESQIAAKSPSRTPTLNGPVNHFVGDVLLY